MGMGFEIFRIRPGIDSLTDDVHLDVITHLGHIPSQAEIGALEGRHGVKADRRQTGPRIGADSDHRDLEDDGLAHAMETVPAGQRRSPESALKRAEDF
jgi:hypothetical protein